MKLRSLQYIFVLCKNKNIDHSDFFVMLCTWNHVDDVVTAINSSQVDVNEKGKEIQVIPIHTVCERGSQQLVQILLEAGADAFVCTQDGETPLWLSCSEGHYQIALTLIDFVKKNHGSERVKKYINRADNTKTSPLWMVLLLSHNEILPLLLDHEANVNAPDGTGMPPLWAACDGGNLRGMVTLLNHNASITEENKPPVCAFSILHFAAKEEKNVALHILLDLISDVNLTDPEGKSALHAAVEAKNTNGVKLLLSKGADRYLTNKQGLSPMHVARITQFSPVIDLMEDRMR